MRQAEQVLEENRFQVGISRLVEEGAFNAAFPLHDVSKAELIF